MRWAGDGGLFSDAGHLQQDCVDFLCDIGFVLSLF